MTIKHQAASEQTRRVRVVRLFKISGLFEFILSEARTRAQSKDLAEK
jgi:hypothetical protein